MRGRRRAPSTLYRVNERARRIEQALDWPLTAAALLVVPVLVIQDGDYGQPWETLGTVLDWGTWLVFAAEAVVMLRVVSDRRAWLRAHPLDVAIVVLTPPFLAALASVRLLRLLRLLRLFRLGPLLRRVGSAESLRYAGVLAAVTAVAGGAAFSALEKIHYSTAEGIYWAVTTMTTVGYGSPSPATTGSKVLAMVVMLVGIGFVAILTAAIAQRFLAGDVEEIEAEERVAVSELRAITERLDRIEAALGSVPTQDAH
jgi:voltage-gated potassium channel